MNTDIIISWGLLLLVLLFCFSAGHYARPLKARGSVRARRSHCHQTGPEANTNCKNSKSAGAIVERCTKTMGWKRIIAHGFNARLLGSRAFGQAHGVLYRPVQRARAHIAVVCSSESHTVEKMKNGFHSFLSIFFYAPVRSLSGFNSLSTGYSPRRSTKSRQIHPIPLAEKPARRTCRPVNTTTVASKRLHSERPDGLHRSRHKTAVYW